MFNNNTNTNSSQFVIDTFQGHQHTLLLSVLFFTQESVKQEALICKWGDKREMKVVDVSVWRQQHTHSAFVEIAHHILLAKFKKNKKKKQYAYG